MFSVSHNCVHFISSTFIHVFLENLVYKHARVYIETCLVKGQGHEYDVKVESM